MIRRRPTFFWKLVLAVMLGLPVGLAWAVWESGRSPKEIYDRLTKRPGPAAPRPPDQPDVPMPPPPPPPPPPPAVTPYSASEFQKLDAAVDLAIFRGKLEDAEKAFKAVEEPRVPAESREAFFQRRRRLADYRALVLLTDAGEFGKPPDLWQIDLKTGSVLYVRILRQSKDDYFCEHLSGIRAGYAKGVIRGAPAKVTELTREPMVREELVSRAKKKKIKMETSVREASIGFTFIPDPGVRPTPMEYFDLADFAASYGLPPAAMALFDRALDADAGAPSAIREIKAQRLAKSFLYYLTNNSKDEAKRILDMLNARFSQTEAFRGLNDVWVADAYEKSVGKKLVDDAPALTHAPVVESTPIDEPPRPTVTPNVDIGEAETACKKGEELIQSGKTHFDLSGSDSNPDGWEKENLDALRCFTQARDEFLRAESIYEARGREVPRSISKRITDCNMLVVMCRKRAL